MLGLNRSINNMPAAAPPTFSISNRDKKARLGTINTSQNVPVPTPASLVYTRRGAMLHLTPDVVERMSPKPSAYGVDILHFISAPGPSTIDAHSQQQAAKAEGGPQGARAFLPSVSNASLIVATNRDPTIYEYGAKPSGDKSIYCTTHSGGKSVTPEEYMSIVCALRPDLFVTMSDEITVSEAGKKRTTSSSKRTMEWSTTCLDQMPSGKSVKCLISIAGGKSAYDRNKSAISAVEAYSSHRDQALGFALSGFGTGEEPHEERQALMSMILPQLPEEGLRFMPGISSPSEVLDAVMAGVDLFDCGYVSSSTKAGLALSFPISPTDEAAAGSSAKASSINIWSMDYRLDKGSLVTGCRCYACTKNSRAYVHHLLQVHEMLAEVLLELHNTHHYLLFFEQIRKEIAAGTLESYARWFKEQVMRGGVDAVEVPERTREEKRPLEGGEGDNDSLAKKARS
jgi:queuine tRNA-ribosyltransferase subunit QTRTD1